MARDGHVGRTQTMEERQVGGERRCRGGRQMAPVSERGGISRAEVATF